MHTHTQLTIVVRVPLPPIHRALRCVYTDLFLRVYIVHVHDEQTKHVYTLFSDTTIIMLVMDWFMYAHLEEIINTNYTLSQFVNRYTKC